jgi:serine/threonine protein kinase
MAEPDIEVPQFQAGQKLFGRYALERKLGQGGMGVVWLAKDLTLDRLTALKFLPHLVLHDRTALDDLREETKRNLELTHPNIVRIYDFEEESATAGISMEYVDGGTLAGLRQERPQRFFEPADLLPWVKQLCTALHYAHTEARIVHRDLKPANLMVSARGNIKITDFGIARSITDSVSRVSRIGQTSGTLVYMSPQQLMGKPSTVADDVYSIGATLYDLITGKPPFFTGSIVAQVQEAFAPSLTERRTQLGKKGDPIPANWEEVIAACLAKEREGRPSTAMEIYERLAIPAGDEARTQTVVHLSTAIPPLPPPAPLIPPPLPQTTVVPPSTRGFPWIGLLLVLAIVGIGGLTAGVYFGFRGSGKHDAAPPDEAAHPAIAPPPSASPTVPQAPAAGDLVANSVPSGAVVSIDGQRLGFTPFTRRNVPAGPHQLRLEADGYFPVDLAVIVKGGETRDTGVIQLVAKPTPQTPVERPAREPSPPQQQQPPSSNGSGYLYPDWSQHRLTRAEVSRLSKEQLWRVRNEIYARHGLIFTSENGRKLARSLGSDYRGTDPDQDRVYNRLNAIEQANVELLKQLENGR